MKMVLSPHPGAVLFSLFLKVSIMKYKFNMTDEKDDSVLCIIEVNVQKRSKYGETEIKNGLLSKKIAHKKLKRAIQYQT